MTMKRTKIAHMESPPSSSFSGGEDARARLKHQGLMQDYEELLKETEAKKKKMQKAIQKKLKLLAEVKFLRRKYKSFLENQAQESQYRLKQSHKIPPPPSIFTGPQNAVSKSEFPSKNRNRSVKEATPPSKCPLLDLNQISLPTGEETEEFQLEWEPLTQKLTGYSLDGESPADDLKLSICRDDGNNSNRVGKRKITWQDQVALRA